MNYRGLALCSASLLGALAFAAPAGGEIVWAIKDCPTGAGSCTVTTGGNTTGTPLAPGRFRVIGQPINWQATYQGTPQRFWVSQGGMNMADVQLSTANGQLGGSFSLPSGLWYISARTALMGPGNYSVSGPNVLGDPHISTMDGVHYDFQGAGEFVLLRSAAANFEVQSRMSPVSTVAPLPPDPHSGLSSCPSINTAAAVRSPRHRISYQPATASNARPSSMVLRIDGLVTRIGRRAVTLDDGTRILRDSATGELNIAFRNRWGVRIIPHWWEATGLWYLDFDFTPATAASGIAGPLAPDSWLPALADGSSVGARPSQLQDRYEVLYRRFADSWRVSAATSLFDYAAGASTDTYTKSWPPQSGSCRLPDMRPLVGVERPVAENACRAIVVPSLRNACIADVMATGDSTFARGYGLTQGPRRSSIRVANPQYRAR